MTDTQQAKSRLVTLSNALDALDAQLDPLFSQNLIESAAALEPLQQAKLHTLLPYLIYDLVFIYLKTQGVDPKTHPVISELERVKQYFDKIVAAETSEKKRMSMDTEAANRFIKHALSQAGTVLKTQEQDPQPSASSGIDPVPVKITEKMAQRAQYQRQLKDTAEEEEEDLEVFDDNNTAPAAPEPENSVTKKRRRAAQDPFAGYGETASSKQEASNIKTTKKAKKRSSKKS